MKQIEKNTKGKVSHILGLQKLILLKCPYYPMQSTDSMQYPSKFKSICHRTLKYPKICMEDAILWYSPAAQFILVDYLSNRKAQPQMKKPVMI